MRGTKKRAKRDLAPDTKYQSTMVAKFVNKIMLDGQKQTATNIVYKAFAEVENDVKQPALTVFETAIKNASPLVEVRSKRIGGATYQVPMEVRPERKVALAMRWIINASRGAKGTPMEKRLATELKTAYSNEGAAIAKRDEMHRMAEANKAFAHYARF